MEDKLTKTQVRHLFLDDLDIEQIEGLRRTMHQPEKRGPVLKAEHPWEGQYIAVFSPPMWVPEEGLYKQVYECRHHEEEKKKYALAVSEDGVNWKKPHLGLVEHRGSTDNNLFQTPDDSRLVHVVHDPDDPDPGRRYKGLLTVPGGRIPVISRDAMHWRKLEAKLPSGDAGTIAFDREKRLFMAMLKRPNSNTVGRSYDISFSHDFLNWSTPRFLFGMDKDRDQEMAKAVIRRRLSNPAFANPLFIEPDPQLGWQTPEWRHSLSDQARATWRAECYNFGVVPYAGLYIGLITAYYATGTALPEKNNTDGFNQIQLAVSRDLQSWHRAGDRLPFLETSPVTCGLVGNYDRLQLGAYNGLIQHKGTIRLYYDGMKRRVPQHDRWLNGKPRDPATLSDSERADWLNDTHSAMCLAELRRDGFVSLDAGEETGYVLTTPVHIDGSKMLLNLDAPQGEAHVEILNEDCTPIPAFAGKNAGKATGNDTQVRVHWPAQQEFGSLSGKTVRLKIRLRHARLYAWYTDQDTTPELSK